MCLTNLKKFKTNAIGYKVFKKFRVYGNTTDPNVPQDTDHYYSPIQGSTAMEMGQTYIADKSKCYGQMHTSGRNFNAYDVGFHIYQSKEGALLLFKRLHDRNPNTRLVIVKVLFDDVTATGYERKQFRGRRHKHNVIVARKMTLAEEVETWTGEETTYFMPQLA